MPTTFHPGPDEVVTIAASEEFPRRISVGEGQKAKVYVGDSIVDAFKEFTVESGSPVEVAQEVRIVGASTVITEVLEPLKTPQGVAADRKPANGKVQVHAPTKKSTEKDEKELAKANEDKPVPSAKK